MAIAGVLIALIEGLNSVLYPLPTGVVPGNLESMRNAISGMPAGAFALVVIGWTVGAFAGSWVAAMLADRRPRVHAAIVVAILLAAGITNMVVLPHPAWVWVAAVLGFLGGGHLGTTVAQRSRVR